MVEAKAVRVDDQQVDLGTAWQQIVEDLQPNQRAWLRPSVPMTLHENTAIIAVPNDFTRNQLEGRLRNHIEDALTDPRPLRARPGKQKLKRAARELAHTLDQLERAVAAAR